MKPITLFSHPKLPTLLNIFFILLFLVLALTMTSCEDWLNDDDDDNDNGGKFSEVITDDIATPWEMTFAPDGRLFFTQRKGIVNVVENGTTKDWLKLDSVVQEVGESGLFGIALHPQFSQNGYVYIVYTYAASKSPLVLVNKVVRYRENPASKTPTFDRVILDGVDGNYLHNMGALEFGPDGMLYATSGEHYEPELSQDPTSLNGKILRMTDDGSVPADNPTPGSLVYSMGHRNPQGIAFHPDTKQLWSTEHGPSVEQGCCNDEINMIQAGKNYGWPRIRGSQQQAGMESPKFHSGDTVTWAPTGGIFVSQGEWKNSMLFTGLRGQALYRVVFDASDPTRITGVERYLYQMFGRLRNVAESPDGMIYIAVSNRDGRGNPTANDDRILSFTQEEIRALSTPLTPLTPQ
jgi:glucose/arabinose dehydrogenase